MLSLLYIYGLLTNERYQTSFLEKRKSIRNFFHFQVNKSFSTFQAIVINQWQIIQDHIVFKILLLFI
jgi:hypothetical protein